MLWWRWRVRTGKEKCLPSQDWKVDLHFFRKLEEIKEQIKDVKQIRRLVFESPMKWFAACPPWTRISWYKLHSVDRQYIFYRFIDYQLLLRAKSIPEYVEKDKREKNVYANLLPHNPLFDNTSYLCQVLWNYLPRITFRMLSVKATCRCDYYVCGNICVYRDLSTVNLKDNPIPTTQTKLN